MRRPYRNWIVTLCLCGLSVAALAQNGKLEPLGELTDASVPDGVKKVLEKTGSHVILDDGSALCDIWLRSPLAAPAKPNSADALYTKVSESTLFGVISFPQAATDFRGQAVKPGFYTLRYELSPDDGNHLGVSQYRDFLLLVPANSDPDPDKVFTFDELVSASRGTTGTKHPGPLSLLDPAGHSGASITKNADGYWVFSSSVKLASGDNMPFALIVKGSAPQ